MSQKRSKGKTVSAFASHIRSSLSNDWMAHDFRSEILNSAIRHSSDEILLKPKLEWENMILSSSIPGRRRSSSPISLAERKRALEAYVAEGLEIARACDHTEISVAKDFLGFHRMDASPPPAQPLVCPIRR